jgi:RNA polymerase sigma-70 factor (ECF subfamily)
VPPRTPSTPDSRADDVVVLHAAETDAAPDDDDDARLDDVVLDDGLADDASADDDVEVDGMTPLSSVPPPPPGDDPGPPHDAAWFDRLVTEHSRAVFRFVARRCARDDAEDLTADVLTVAWRRRDDVPDGAELPWLYRTAGFVVANHRRKHRPVPVAVVPDEPDDDDPALRAVRDERVREVLAVLGARDRQILLLNAWEGLTGEALAQVLGIGRGGADAALSRARARLRDAWSAQDA